MFDTLSFSLASAVADTGTVTVGYPTDRSKGHYDWSTAKHKLTVNGNLYQAPADFTLTFNANASNITLTNASGGTWPANAACRLEMDRPGWNSFDPRRPADSKKVRMIEEDLYVLDLGSPNVLDADGIAASQSVASTTATLNGALASGGSVTLDVPRNVVGAWTGTAILTVTGQDEYGNTMIEKSASGTSMTGKKAFKKVTSCSFNANVTSATIGTGDVLGLPVAIQKIGAIIAEMQDGNLLARSPGKVYIPFEIEQTELLAPTNEEIVCPVTGHIAAIRGVVQSAVTTGGAITVKVGSTDVTGLTFTIADADAAGTRYSDTPTTWHDATAAVSAGDLIQIVPAAAINTAGQLNGMIELDVSAAGQCNGTVVSSDNSEATGTTGDVRGTYDPLNALDGSIGIKLLVHLTDPDNKGVPQYTG